MNTEAKAFKESFNKNTAGWKGQDAQTPLVNTAVGQEAYSKYKKFEQLVAPGKSR